MSESDLTTADCFDRIDEAVETSLAVESTEARPSAAVGWERVTSRFSLCLATALVVSVAILATGYYTVARDRVSARAKKSSHPLDWLLWFGGAKDDQTFEKFIKDTTAKSQREWDEKYRNSPAYQVDPEQIDWKHMESKLDPAPFYMKPTRRSR